MDMPDKEIFRVLALLDGRPGHEKQTKGILRELEQIVPIKVEFRKVSYNSVLKDFFLTLQIFLLSLIKSDNDERKFHFVIGTGRRTHLPALKEKMQNCAVALTCMTPAFYLRAFFDLCFIPEHDGGKENENVFFTIGPANCSIAKKKHEKDKGLILVGGTDKSHSWNDSEIIDQIKKIVSIEKQVHWTISSSPRTPASSVVLLEELEKELENCRFYRYENTPAGWVEEQYALNKTVWVTADSMSMVYEALTAGCHVGLLPVRWKGENSKFARSEAQLLNRKIVFSFQDWGKGESGIELDKEPLNEAERCAKEIVRRWCQKN